ncbi:MAG: HIT family protein [Candidatus Njordarchaeia archaeon]
MDRLWAPWRIEYIETAIKHEGCFLCDYPKMNKDDETFILWRGKYTFIILNRYPYNSGHVLIAPYRHVSKLEDLTDEEILEMTYAIKLIMKAVDLVMKPHGYNVGLNLGQAAGASVYEHIHLHVVPRWTGDTNFMPVISNTKVISEGLKSTYMKLREKIGEILKMEGKS